MVKTALGIAFFAVVLILLGQFVFNVIYKFPQKVTYGVTFSPQYAKYLGLDFKKIFISSLDDLKIKDFRIPTYWEEIEKKKDKLNFDDVDFLISEAGKRKARILLVVGFRQPRWPECHIPSWTVNLSLSQRHEQTLEFIKKVVERYERSSSWSDDQGRNNPIVAYQVENEPFLPYFGKNCDKGDENFLKEEVNLVRSLTGKPIIISDSGELGSWIIPMQVSDIFGTTLYREVYNPLMGYFSYPILPYLYNLKSQIIKAVFAPKNQKTIIVELQSEPWIGTVDLMDNSRNQAEFFPLKKLKSYVDYAKNTGFDTAYLWGVEWWYWMGKHGYPQYLDYAKSLF